MDSEPPEWWLDWINVLIGTMWDALTEMTYSGHADSAARPRQY
ncbi:MAG: hypothetical protein WBR28_27825 [Mycobacterium sp.]